MNTNKKLRAAIVADALLMVGGVGIGYFLDQKMGTDQHYLMIGALVGAGLGGMFIVLAILKR